MSDRTAELSAALLSAIDAPVPVNPTCKIGKSKFMAGLQCPKREYLQVRLRFSFCLQRGEPSLC